MFIRELSHDIKQNAAKNSHKTIECVKNFFPTNIPFIQEWMNNFLKNFKIFFKYLPTIVNGSTIKLMNRSAIDKLTKSIFVDECKSLL
jgi:hypothetical protein